jgi:hypothetical protein
VFTLRLSTLFTYWKSQNLILCERRVFYAQELPVDKNNLLIMVIA